jgi:hypothetical protein
MNRYTTTLAAALVAAALVACGGGGGDPGTPATGTGSGTGSGTGTGTGGSTTTPDPTVVATAKVTDFALFADKTSLANTGADTAKITVQAVDANRNVVSGATVSASADANTVFAPDGTKTDETGTFTGTLSIGADKTDRDVTVAVTVNGITKRTTVHVGGSRITMAANPASPQPGQQVTLTANLKDSASTPVAGQTITFNSAAAGINSRTATTSAAGDASITITAPATAGVYAVSASGSGTVAADLQLTVLTSGTSVPVAAIPAGADPSLAASPNVLSVNSVGSTANKSVLRFLMLDANNNPIPNVRVRFLDLTTGLPAQGASIASGSSTLFTDNSGIASTQYISGQNSSSTNGVRVRACFGATDLTATELDNCRNGVAGSKFVDTTLTVAGQALAVSIGDDNKLEANTVAGTYTKRFAVTIADSAGRPVANAPVDISVDLTHYGKALAPASPRTSLATVSGLSLTQASPSMINDPSIPGGVISWCPNEDVNRNGIVDATTVFVAGGANGARGENYNGSVDSNGQPTLEPRKSDLLINYDVPTVTNTDANGILVIKVTYSQRFATWLAYKIRVTTNVSGSQGMAERLFVTDALEADADNGSFNTPPYGTHSCLQAN